MDLIVTSILVSVPFLLYLCYLNYKIYQIGKDIYRVSEALLEVNVELYKVSLELCKHTKQLQEKI